MARSTPRSPPAISPYSQARPVRQPFAPRAMAATMSPPLVIPVSSSTSARSPIASTTGASTSSGTGVRSSCRAPWLDTITPSAPRSTTALASATVVMPLISSGPGQIPRSQSMASYVIDGSNSVPTSSAIVPW